MLRRVSSSRLSRLLSFIHLPLDLEASPLQRAGVVPERSRGISAAEDVLVEVDSPDEVLVLPGLSQTRELDVHGAIVLEHVVALAEKSCELLDANVLTHLELSDLVELLFGDVAIVHAEDVALVLGDARAAESVGGVRSTLLGDRDTGDLRAVVERGKFGQGSPATANIEHGLALLQVDLLTDGSHLVVLQLLESFLTRRVRDETAGVNHARAEEVGVVVVAAVVVGPDLLHVLVTGVKEDVAREGAEEEFHEGPGESKVRPVVAVLQDVEQVAVSISFAIDVHLGEVLERDLLPAAVVTPEGIGLEGDVLLNGPVGELGFVVHTRAVAAGDGPDDDENREEQDDAEEDLGLEAATHKPAQEPWCTNEGRKQHPVVEGVEAGAFSGERSILDGGRLGGADVAVLLRKGGGLSRGGLDEADILRQISLNTHLCGSGGGAGSEWRARCWM